MKVVINKRFGGFGLSEDAFRWLIDQGVPVKPYIEQQRDAETGLWKHEPLNDGEHIADWLHPQTTGIDPSILRLCGRFHASWLTEQRTHPLLVKVVEALGERANGALAKLLVVEVPDGVEFDIEDYDGMESIHEKHRSWG
jgi:hypothetical protein